MVSSSTTINTIHWPRSLKSPSNAPIEEGSIRLCSPVSPTEGRPWDNTSTSRTFEQVVADDLHGFHPPGEGDSRSPCPALNTLANHGYLPRSGRDITVQHLLVALQHPETYQLSGPLAKLLVYGGLFLVHDFNASPICLHDLARHGGIEHDASIVHQDTPAGRLFAPTRCDTKLLNDLLNDGDLTSEKVEKRRVELENVSPLDAVHQEIARGEWALVMVIFGKAHGGNVPADFLRVWLKENRFPEGWRPTHEQGFIATVSEASKLRNGMKVYLDKHKESPGECQEEMVLRNELKASSPTGMTRSQWFLTFEAPGHAYRVIIPRSSKC